jgi:hypothetical protein
LSKYELRNGHYKPASAGLYFIMASERTLQARTSGDGEYENLSEICNQMITLFRLTEKIYSPFNFIIYVFNINDQMF